jgi:hypothetical protein
MQEPVSRDIWVLAIGAIVVEALVAVMLLAL